MANLKDIKTRISSVTKTRQITKAMKLVAGARLKRATDAAMNARPYKDRLAAVLASVAARAGDSGEPLLQQREHVSKALVVILTSDRGLCGAFNNALLRRALDFLEKKRAEGVEIHIAVYGRKGATFLANRGWPVDRAVTDLGRHQKMDLVRPLADDMTSGYTDGRYDEVWLVSNEFVNTLTQRPRFDRMIPLQVQTDHEAGPAEGDLRYEPEASVILGALLPLYVRTLVLQAFLETVAGEYAARMTAMDSATRNASDLIDSLTLDYNRARQAAITTELIEIVSGANAL